MLSNAWTSAKEGNFKSRFSASGTVRSDKELYGTDQFILVRISTELSTL